MELKKKVIFGIGWLGLLQGVNRFIVLLKLAVLARFLGPADFGVFALVTTTVNTLETLTGTGFSYAFINLQSEISLFAKTFWVINIIRGLILSLVTIGVASSLEVFFQIPSLSSLLFTASLIPLLKGIQNPAVMVFQKNLEFHKEFLFRFLPTIINTIFTFILVLYFRSASALVYGLIISTLFETIISFIIIKSSFSSPFSIKKAKKIFFYSKWLTTGSIFDYLTGQIDNMFVGKMFGSGALGLYDFAFRLANVAFSEITDIISRVMFPAYAQIKNDIEKLQKIFIKHTIAVSLPTLGITLLFLLFPSEIITIVFGPQWKDATEILRILSIYGCIHAITGPAGPLFLAIGRPHVLSVFNMLNFLFIILLIYPLALLKGLPGISWAIVLAYILSQPYQLYHMHIFLTQKNIKQK